MRRIRVERSFRFRLLLASLLVEGLMLALLVGNSLRLINEHLVQQTEHHVKETELAYRAAVAVPLASRDYATLRDILDGWRQAEDVTYLAVTDPDGRILASSGWPEHEALPTSSSRIETGTILHVVIPVNYLGQTYGSVHYGLKLDFLAAARNDLFVQGTLIALAEIASSLLLLSAIGYWLTRRLIKLEEASDRISQGEYHTPVEISGADEIAHLAENFNLMAKAVAGRIEELKDAQESLRLAKDAAESANVAKSQFLANMSHELRTPMHGVLGMGQLLMMTKLDDDQREYVATILQSANDLLEVVNDVLDISRLESHQIKLNPAPFHLPDILPALERRFGEQAREKGIELVVSMQCGHDLELLGDQTRLSQVLANLLSNAIKFTERGRVSLDIDCLPLAGDRVEVRAAVTDTGIGISADIAERLFSPFFQADASATRRHGGTGLGLALCKRIADLMGGEISVRSSPGEGSTFAVRLPLPRSEHARRPERGAATEEHEACAAGASNEIRFGALP